MPNHDPSEHALKQVKKTADSEPVKGEELLESEELRRVQLPEAEESKSR